MDGRDENAARIISSTSTEKIFFFICVAINKHNYPPTSFCEINLTHVLEIVTSL